MTLAQFYPSLKQAHVTLVAASGALFAVRGAAVLARQPWAMQPGWRRLSYVIDTLLLAAGTTLWFLLALNPRRDVWFGTKLALLLVYIVLGSLALKRGRTPAVRAVSYVAALSVFGFTVGVALRHRALGFLAASP